MEEVGSFGTGLAGSCDLLDVRAGNPSWLLCKRSKYRS